MDYSRRWILVICGVQAAIVAAVITWVTMTGRGTATEAGAEGPAAGQEVASPSTEGEGGADPLRTGAGPDVKLRGDY